MEKIIRSLSALITAVVIYVFCAYVYLSFKGFVWQDGTFVLVSAAQAAEANVSNGKSSENKLATSLDANLSLNFSKEHIIGSPEAALTLFEFSSPGCTHCADFHLNMLPKLEKDFVEDGKLNVVFVSFPLEKKSMQAAMLAECVPAKNKENYLNMVFEKQREWMLSSDSAKVLSRYALANGLNKEAVEECLHNDDLAAKIISNRQEAIDQLKMQGTPAFLISGKGKNEIIYGVPNYDALKTYLEQRGAE